jgi:hypothetical protein
MHKSVKSSLLLGLLTMMLSAGLGLRWGQQQPTLNVGCSGQRVQELPEQDGAERWLFYRYNLALNPNGRGSFRLVAQLRDADGEPLGQMHRHTSLSHKLQDELLLLTVEHSGKSENDNLDSKQLPMVSLALLQEDAVLSYRVRRLSANQYLLDNGVGIQQICQSVTPAQPQAGLSHWLSELLPAANTGADE